MSDYDEKTKINKAYIEKSQSSDDGKKGDKTEDAEGKTATEDTYVNEAAVNDDKSRPWVSEETIPKTEDDRDQENRAQDSVSEKSGKDEKARPFVRGDGSDERSSFNPVGRGVQGISDARFNNLAEQFEIMQQATNQSLGGMRNDITNLRQVTDGMRNDITNLQQATTERLRSIETSLERNNDALLNKIQDMFATMLQHGRTTGQLASADIAPGTASSARGVQADGATHGNAPGGVGMQPTRFQSPPSLQHPLPQMFAPVRPAGHPAIRSERSNVASDTPSDDTSDYSSMSNQ